MGTIEADENKSERTAFSSFKTVYIGKKSFRIFALSASSEYIVPLNERGGTDVVESGLIKFLSVVHLSLEKKCW